MSRERGDTRRYAAKPWREMRRNAERPPATLPAVAPDASKLRLLLQARVRRGELGRNGTTEHLDGDDDDDRDERDEQDVLHEVRTTLAALAEVKPGLQPGPENVHVHVIRPP